MTMGLCVLICAPSATVVVSVVVRPAEPTKVVAPMTVLPLFMTANSTTSPATAVATVIDARAMYCASDGPGRAQRLPETRIEPNAA